MSSTSSKLWIITTINVIAAVVTLVCCAYLMGIQDSQSLNTKPESTYGAAKEVRPNPMTGQGLHPTFDCKDMTRTLPSNQNDSRTIKNLAKNAQSLEGQTVSVRGVIVQAFPNIMGLNWFCVCERPRGEVLVVSGEEWIEPGHPVVVTGKLAVDRNVGGAYRFPLFIEDGDLEGAHVQPRHGDAPSPTYYL